MYKILLEVGSSRFRMVSSLIETRRQLHQLKKRGFIKYIHPPIEKEDTFLRTCKATYCGFDPTADSLHVGNLLPILLLIQLQKKGLKPIALVGESTAQLGDPSGRLTERNQIENTVVETNCLGLEHNLNTVFENHQRFFHKGDQLPALDIVRNTSWYNGLDVIKFLGTVGRQFRIGPMLSREAVRQRMATSEGLSVAEFSYQIFQAYDWLQLFEKHECLIQIGGQDQLGNIDAGHDLIRRIHGKNAVGLMTPLIVSETGNKYGKSAGNAVWLSAEKTSPYELYQFFLRMSDSEALRLLPLYSLLEGIELEEILATHRKNPAARPCQKRIAEDMTILLHGPEELELARKATDLLFSGRTEILSELDERSLRRVFSSSSYVEMPRDLLRTNEMKLVDFGLRTKLFLREEDAKRIIAAGGLYLNMHRVTDQNFSESFVLPSGMTLARVGKKNYSLVKWI